MSLSYRERNVSPQDPYSRRPDAQDPEDRACWTSLRITRGVAHGDAEAFDVLYDQYGERVRRYLIVLAGGDEELAHDALQETMLRVVRHLRPLPHEDALWRWLRRAARTTLIDRIRRTQTRRAALLRLQQVRRRSQGDAPSSVLLELLSQEVSDLEPTQRRLVEAHYLEGRSQEELAATWGLTRKAVESRLLRARRLLKERLLRGLAREQDGGTRD